MLLTGERWIDGVVLDGKTNNESQLANYRWIGPDYITTLQQRIIEGRPLDEHDRTQKNAVISEATAKAVWPGQSPINRQFQRNGNNLTVVGVVADAHNNSLRTAPVNMVYLPYLHNPPYGTYFLFRSTQAPTQLIESLRSPTWTYTPNV